MKKNILQFYVLILAIVICHIKSLLTDEKRKILMNKLTKKISLENAETMKSMKEKFYSQELKSMHYSVEKINEILDNYGLPQNFSFFDDQTVTPVVKDQQRCGCCWSHAATTSLAYRYHIIGIDVDLSPQDGLSCYIRDCNAGNYDIDPELNLVKNGTLTEGCLPFSSGDGSTIEPCPTTCKDGSEFKKYYAQNAYMTRNYYTQDTFYEIVTLMFDQLITYGPVVAGIDVYQDFVDLNYDPKK